jgi:hypothetical protein
MPTFTVGPYSFSTKKELKAFEMDTMTGLSLTESLRASASGEVFAFYFDLVHRHPEADRKLAGGISDFRIVPPERDSRAKELQIIHNDGTCSSISRGKCVTQLKETSHGLLRAALRTAIENQIREFRALHVCCARCGTASGDIDHILTFSRLADEFCTGRDDIPSEFTKVTGTNQHCFLTEEGFSAEWQQYHRTNATLRRLCKPCHTTRSVWDPQT